LEIVVDDDEPAFVEGGARGLVGVLKGCITQPGVV